MPIKTPLFDAHFHIIDPDFPLTPNNGYLPEPFTVPMYQNAAKPFHVIGGVVVSGSFQAFDQGYLLAALKMLGSNYVGVLNLPADTEDQQITALYQKGIKGVRFNLFRGGSETIDHLLDFAKRIYDLCGMHIELYISGEQIAAHVNLLKQLPKFSIDHLGLTKEGSNALLKLVENGAHVKATGFMRVDFDPLTRMKQIHTINPEALLFGTDLPGTRASRLFDITDLQLIQDNFSQKDCENILFENAIKFYGVTI